MDTRVRNGILEHQISAAPETWVRLGLDELGHPRTIYQSDTLAISISPQDGHVIFAFGGHLVSAPPDVAAAINDDLVVHTLAGKGVVVAAQVAQLQAQIDAKKAEQADVVASFDVEIQAKAAELAAVTTQLDVAKAPMAAEPAGPATLAGP